MTANWEPVVEADDLLTGEHTIYAKEFVNKDGKSCFCWLTAGEDGRWQIEVAEKGHFNETFKTIAMCTTLTSAKRYAARYILK